MLVSYDRLENTCLANIEELSSQDTLNDEELDYYNNLKCIIDIYIEKYLDWLGTDEGQEAFHNREFFDAIGDELDKAVNDANSNVNQIIERIYCKGLDKGYKDIKKSPVFNDACRYGLKATQEYNLELISNLINDLHEIIKQEIFTAIAENQSIQEVACSISDIGLNPLKNNALTFYQRASLIARTEIARSLTTGCLQAYANYGVEKVKILTCDDYNVCQICRKSAENIYTLKEAVNLIPLHPACRCSIIAVIEHEDTSINYDLLKEATSDNVVNLTGAQSPFWAYYNAPCDAKPFVLDDNALGQLRHLMSKKDLEDLKALLELLNETCHNCEFEWMIGNTNKRFPMKKAYTSWERDNVFLPQELDNLGEKEHISILIHNHAWGINILPSDKDIKLIINNNVKYGVITNNSGLVVIKNNNPSLNKMESSKIEEIIISCEKQLIKDLKTYGNIKFDYSDNHKRILNEYVKKNQDKYVKLYCESLQENFDIDIIFINVK